MKRYFLTLLIGFAWLGVSCQTNGTFNNLDVRNRTTLRGFNYVYDSTFFKPGSVNIPFMSGTDSIGWVLTTSKGAEAQLVRVSFKMLKDSIIAVIPASLWELSGDTVKNINEYKVLMTDSIYIDRYAIPMLKTGEPVADQLLIMRKLSPNPFGQIARVGFNDLIDTLKQYGINYWTYVDSATDTLKNNVSTAGVVSVFGNLELQTTTASVGQLKQNGATLLHTYSDGGGANLFLGEDAGILTLTGNYNTGMGYHSLDALTVGNNNTAFGYNSLTDNTEGEKNIAFGEGALYSNKENDGSTALGYNAMYYADSRTSSERITYNTAVGYEAMRGSSTAANNTGQYNTAVGYQSMDAATSGAWNVSLGTYALGGVTTGNNNVGIGYNSLWQITTTSDNVGTGRSTLGNLTSGAYNSAFGSQSGFNVQTGSYNSSLGYNALGGDTDGTTTFSYNVAVGASALGSDSTGTGNVAVGYSAGNNVESGSYNVFLGYHAGKDIDSTASNKLFIENSNSATPLIWGDFATDSLRWNADVAFVKDLWYEDRYWRDATVSGTALAPGANAPSLRTVVGGLKQYGYAPSVQNDISYGQAQINHDFALDSSLHAHMHFMLEESAEAGDTAVFQFEYSWADIDESFPVSDTITVLIPCNGVTAKQHKLVEFGEITGDGGNNVSSSIIFRLERLQNSVHDTYDGANEYIIVLDVDFHFPIDAPGSRQEYIK